MTNATRTFIPKALAGAVALATLGIYAAAVFNPASQPYFTVAPYTLIETDLAKGNTRAFRPWYENGAWQGDVIEYTILADGTRSTDVVVGANPATNGTTNWSARAVFASKAASDSDYWKNRKIITSITGTDQAAFLWSNLTATQRTAVDPAVAADTSKVASYDSPILNYVRGDRSQEKDKTGGVYRIRYSLLGDIIGSQPVYVGAPTASYTLPGYSTYKTNQAARAGRVYVGANDGMVHAFEARTTATTGVTRGEEVFAYVPSMVFDNLDKLAATPYAHTYFVDGVLVAGDAKIGTDWKTILAGGLGAGGKGFFLLDVTDPALSSQASNTGTDKKVLREVNGSNAHMGYVYGKPTVALLPNGTWYAVTGNGYGSTNGDPVLMFIPVDPSNTSITNMVAAADSGNGLSAPSLVDTDGDNDADVAYAGDLKGNLWKFNLNDLTSTPTKLFSAGVDKPITTAPEVASHPNGGYLVYFGTGSLLSQTDADNSTNIQSVYAIWDCGGCTVTDSNILTQTLTEATHGSGPKVRLSSGTAINWIDYKGWKVNLPAGERVIGNPQLRGARLQFTTTNPTFKTTNSTNIEGASWLMELNWLNGGDSNAVLFDLNNDGSLTDADKVSDKFPMALYLGIGNISQPTLARITGGTDIAYINGLLMPLPKACTVDCPGGFLNGHIDVTSDSPFGGTVAPKYSAGPPATGTVTLRDGTVVNKNSSGLGAMVDGYSHGYDKIHGVTYVDYFNLEPRRTKARMDFVLSGSALKTADPWLNRVWSLTKPDGTADNKGEVYRDSAKTLTFNPDQKFIVVLANADLTTGGTLKIGCRTWNVKDYQEGRYVGSTFKEGIMQQLDAGKTPSQLVDNFNGGGLIFTINNILNDNGGTCADGSKPTLRISFTSLSIYQQAVHGTRSECVLGLTNYADDSANDPNTNPNAHITQLPSQEGDGFRWRNGALTMQLLAVNSNNTAAYTLQPAAAGSGNNALKLLPVKQSTRFGGTYAKAFTASKSGNKVTLTTDKGTNESGLLYESSIFWHFGDMAEFRNQQVPACYGTSNYNNTYVKEVGGITYGEYSNQNGNILEGVTDAAYNEYAAAWLALQAFLNSGVTDETKLESLLKKIADLLANNPNLAKYHKYRIYAPGHVPEQHLRSLDKGLTSGDGSTGSSTDATPNSVEDISKSLKPLLGPNFIPGRRTWIDPLQ